MAMPDSIPDLTLLKECETHFHNKFDEFFRLTSPRKIVQIEIVGFRPFLNSTGYFKFNASGFEYYGIFPNFVVVRNGELLPSLALRHSGLAQCFSDAKSLSIYAWIGPFGPCRVRNIEKLQFDVNFQAAIIWINDGVEKAPTEEDFQKVNMDQTCITQNIQQLKVAVSGSVSKANFCSNVTRLTFPTEPEAILPVLPGAFKFWGADFGLFQKPVPNGVKEWGLFLFQNVSYNGCIVNPELLRSDSRMVHFDHDESTVHFASVGPFGPVRLSSAVFFNTIRWHASTFWIWNKDHPDYRAFLEEKKCSDPDEISVEGLTDKSEQVKEDLPIEAAAETNLAEDPASNPSNDPASNPSNDPASNPSNDPNFFNYFMSQFVSLKNSSSFKRVVRVELLPKRVFRQSLGLFTISELGSTHYGLFPNTVIFLNGKRLDSKTLSFTKLTQFLKDQVLKKRIVYAEIGHYGPVSIQSDDLKFYRMDWQAFLIWITDEGTLPPFDMLGNACGISASESFLPTPIKTDNIDPVGTGAGQSNVVSKNTTKSSNLTPQATISEPGKPKQFFSVDSEAPPERTLVLVQSTKVRAWKKNYGFFKKRLDLAPNGLTELGVFSFDEIYHNGARVNPEHLKSELSRQILFDSNKSNFHAWIEPVHRRTLNALKLKPPFRHQLKWQASSVWVWVCEKNHPEYRKFLKERLNLDKTSKLDLSILSESLKTDIDDIFRKFKDVKKFGIDTQNPEFLIDYMDQFNSFKTSREPTKKLVEVRLTGRRIRGTTLEVFIFWDDCENLYKTGIFPRKAVYLNGLLLSDKLTSPEQSSMSEELYDNFMTGVTWKNKIVYGQVGRYENNLAIMHCEDMGTIRPSFQASLIWISDQNAPPSQEFLDKLVPQTEPAPGSSNQISEEPFDLHVIQNLLDQLNPSTLNILNAGASVAPPVTSIATTIPNQLEQSISRIKDFACLEDFESQKDFTLLSNRNFMTKVRNLVKLSRIMDQAPLTPEVLKSHETSKKLPVQNLPPKNIVTQANNSPAAKQFKSFFISRFDAFKSSEEIAKKMTEIEVIDYKDQFGIFKFEEKGIEYFGIFPNDVVYMDNRQVHPDNFEGGKIKTFLSELASSRQMIARVGLFGPRTTNTHDFPAICLSYQADQILIMDKPQRDHSHFGVETTVLACLDSVCLLEEKNSKEKIFLHKNRIFIDGRHAWKFSKNFKEITLKRYLELGTTVFCNRIAKPEIMEIPSICFQEHCLLKAANHLAAVAWRGSKPDDETLTNFEMENDIDKNHTGVSEVENNTSPKVVEEEEDIPALSETEKLVDAITNRILTIGELDSDLDDIFTSEEEVKLGIQLSNALLSAIEEFTTPGDQHYSEKSRRMSGETKRSLSPDAQSHLRGDRRSRNRSHSRPNDQEPFRSRSPTRSSRYSSGRYDEADSRRSRSRERIRDSEKSYRSEGHSESRSRSKHERSESPNYCENLYKSYQEYIESIERQLTRSTRSGSGTRQECTSPVQSYLKEFQEMELLLSGKISESKDNNSSNMRSSDFARKRSVSNGSDRSSKSPERSRKKRSSSRHSLELEDSKRGQSCSGFKLSDSLSSTSQKVTEQDIYRHLQPQQKFTEKDVYLHLRNKDTSADKSTPATSTWIPLTHFPAVLEHNTSRFYYVSKTKMPLNEEIVLEELRSNFVKLRSSKESLFSGKFDLVEKILSDKSNMIGPLSTRMGRDCYKIPDNLWQQNFQHFQIDLTDCVKLDARPDAITKRKVPVLYRQKKSSGDDARCQALMEAWNADCCYIVDPYEEIEKVHRSKNAWKRYQGEAKKFLTEKGLTSKTVKKFLAATIEK